jgi:hypothetical protein
VGGVGQGRSEFGFGTYEFERPFVFVDIWVVAIDFEGEIEAILLCILADSMTLSAAELVPVRFYSLTLPSLTSLRQKLFLSWLGGQIRSVSVLLMQLDV